MANKKLRLTYFWADETAMLEDFQGKISAEMTAWANKFYAQYGFELDVDPPEADRTSVQRASKYALVKSQGVIPDLRRPSDLTKDEDDRLAKLDGQLQKAAKERDDALLQSKNAQARYKALQPDIQTLLQSTTMDPALVQRVSTELPLVTEAMDRTTSALQSKNQAYDRLIAQERAIVAQREAKLSKIEAYEAALRFQISSKFRNDNVGSETRHTIVFCRPAVVLQMRVDWDVNGETFPQLDGVLVSLQDRVLFWPFPFTIINLKSTARGTIAHEVVHAAGHSHPRDWKRLQAKLADVKLPTKYVGSIPTTSIESAQLIYSYGPNYEVIEGGLLDGPDNNIMNYNRPDDPLKCLLMDDDKALLEKAPFVKP